MKIICVWFLWYGAQQIIFSHFGPSFALLHTPRPNTPENQNFKKMKEKRKRKKNPPGDINILHKCTINDNHIYGFWDMKCTRQNFFVILGHFLPFYPNNTPKNENFKKMKKSLEISFYKSAPKIMIISYTVPEIWHMTHVIVIFHLGLFFVLLSPNSPKSQNFKKIIIITIIKKASRYHHFTNVYQKL